MTVYLTPMPTTDPFPQKILRGSNKRNNVNGRARSVDTEESAMVMLTPTRLRPTGLSGTRVIQRWAFLRVFAWLQTHTHAYGTFAKESCVSVV